MGKKQKIPRSYWAILIGSFLVNFAVLLGYWQMAKLATDYGTQAVYWCNRAQQAEAALKEFGVLRPRTRIPNREG